MATYSINPTYFRVTWNQSSPTNYTGLTGTQAGGVDAVSPIKYNNRILVVGTASITGTPMGAGDNFFINGQKIIFASTDTLADIIAKINMASLLTNVISYNINTYVVLTNIAGHEGEVIEIAEGSNALANLGMTAGYYDNFPCVIGGAFTTFTNGDTFNINGIPVTMTTTGGLDQAGAVSTINALTASTGVVAYLAGSSVLLASVNGQPWTTSGATATKLGFPAGIFGGSPITINQCTTKTLANLRWQLVVNQLETFSTPFMVGDILGVGNYDGTAELTSFDFTVGYEHPDQVSTVSAPNEPSPGTVLNGVDAIKRAVARGLSSSITTNVNLWDPTIETRGDFAVRANPVRITTLVADGIDTVANLATLEGNITVTVIAYA